MRSLKVFIVVVFLFSINVSPQKYPVEETHQLILKGINALSEEDFSGAKIYFEKIKSEYPSLPIGDIYLAAAEISLSFDFGIPYNHSYIKERFESAQNRFENVNSNMPVIWKNYFMATLKTYKAYYYYLNEDWVGAVTTGLSALSYLEDCYELDKNFHEAKMGLGIYKYWKSNKTEWIPFFSDEKQAGIELIKEASEKMLYNRALALNSLFWIYLEEKKFYNAVEVAERGTELYPKSSYAHFILGRALETTDKQRAIESYKNAFRVLQTKEFKSNYRPIFIKYKLAQLNYDLNNKVEAKKYCTEILSVKTLTDHEKNLLKRILQKVKDLNASL